MGLAKTAEDLALRCQEWKADSPTCAQDFSRIVASYLGLGFDKKAFAGELGISPASVNRWADGTSFPHLAVARVIVTAIEVLVAATLFDGLPSLVGECVVCGLDLKFSGAGAYCPLGCNRARAR